MAPVYGHQPVHWSNSGASSYSDDRPTCGVWRVHTMFADVTWCHVSHIDTRHCHAVSHVTTSPGGGNAGMTDTWPDQRRGQEWGLIKDGTVYGERWEVLVWEIVWSLERRSGDTQGLWHKVWGCRNVDTGTGSCKSLSRGNVSVPWCQHQRPGARRSLASCSVRSCSAHPGSAAVKSSAVSHGPAGRAAHTNTRSVSLKPSSGKK